MSISRLRDGTYVDVNDAFERITGKRRSEVLGRTSTELGIWADPPARDVLVAKDPFRGFRIRIPDPHHGAMDGQVREALVNAVIFETRREQLMIALLRDVTDAQAAPAPCASEAQVCTSVRAITLPMSYCSDADDFPPTTGMLPGLRHSGSTRCRPKVARVPIWVSGYSPNSVAHYWSAPCTLENRSATWKSACATPTAPCADFAVSRAVRGRAAHVDRTELFRHHRASPRPRGNRGPNVRLEERVAQRTADLQAANQELTQTLETLHVANRTNWSSPKLAALGALVAGVAHELNTPIGNALTVSLRWNRIAGIPGPPWHRTQTFGPAEPAGRHPPASDIPDLQPHPRKCPCRSLSFKQVAVDQTSAQRRQRAGRVGGRDRADPHPSTRKAGCQIEVEVPEGTGPQMDSYPGDDGARCWPT